MSEARIAARGRGVATTLRSPLDTPAGGVAPQVAERAQQQEPAPMRASLAPIPARAEPALSLEFAGDSWVDIIGSDGLVLESGLLTAGEHRSYAVGEVARMKLGNATVVRVEHEGQVQDLAPYLRANVARFTVSSDGSLAPQAE